MREIRRTTELPVPAGVAYEWHTRPGAFERLTPPWENVRVVQRAHGVDEGELMVARIRRGPFHLRWIAEHGQADPGRCFSDDQISGPFAQWHHVHRFSPLDDRRCLLEDEVRYELPGGRAGDAAAGRRVDHELARLFSFRHRRTRDDLSRHAGCGRRLRIAITGASGMIGTELSAFLSSGGHEIVRLVRHPPRALGEVQWDPGAGKPPRLDALEGMDGLVHLSGANIGGGRWTRARRRAVLASRIDGTATIASALAALDRPPSVFISMSGIGHYGDRGDEVLDEERGQGSGFLADVTAAWEAATAPAWQASVPTIILRTGVLMTARGGALKKMLPAFLAGAGGPIAGGRQWMSWISLDDYLGVVYWLLCEDALRKEALTRFRPGPNAPLVLNATSPEPVTNRELTSTLARVVRRPALLPLPAAAINALFGEMGVQTLLCGQRALPIRLQQAGFQFLYPRLEDALRLELGRLPEAA